MSKNTLSSDLNASERAAMNTNGSVVLVEDDAGLAHALITLFEFDQYEVVHFSSGERFLDDITSQDSQMTSTTCCVLLDLNLNEKRDGLQIFKEAKKNKIGPAEITYNAGYTSNYLWRGATQNDNSGAASIGADAALPG